MSYDAVHVLQSIWDLKSILEPIEYLISVDHRSIWRRHLAWAYQNGGELRSHLTQRFSANMMFMALMLSSELMMLFNSAHIASEMRADMRNFEYDEVKFWIGLLIVVSVFLTLFTLVSTFTAWGVVSSISDANAVVILRSSIGQYAAQLPSRLLVSSLYSFLLCIALWVFELLPTVVAVGLTLIMSSLFLHIVSVYSSLGRLIIHTGAMGSKPVLDPKFEKMLLPSALTNSLVAKAVDCPSKRLTATAKYRESARPGIISRVKRIKPSRVIRPGYDPGDSSRFSSSETEMIHNTAYAFFGSTQGSSVGTDDATPDPIREEAPELSQKTTNHVMAASREERLEAGSPHSKLSEKSIGFIDGKSAKEDIGAFNGRPSDLRSDDSLRSTESEVGKQHGKEAGMRQRRNHRRRRRASRAEWEHESLARHLYGGPPAADEDDEEDPSREVQHDANVRRASQINFAAAGPRPRHLWWGNKSDASDNFLKSVTEESPFFGGTVLEESALLGSIRESKKGILTGSADADVDISDKSFS